jgi:hypothetical protein
MRNSWTIGTELELADARRDTPLPGCSTWDHKDYTIVNSNGIANDPLGKTWKFGGEINTEPTSSVDAQVNVIQKILDTCSPIATANYRSNLHVHIRVPGLAADATLVKRTIEWVQTHVNFSVVDPLPLQPTATAALVRWRRRKQSHHTILQSNCALHMLP